MAGLHNRRLCGFGGLLHFYTQRRARAFPSALEPVGGYPILQMWRLPILNTRDPKTELADDPDDEGTVADGLSGGNEPGYVTFGARRQRRRKRPRKRLSDLLREIVDQGEKSHITVGDLVRSMDGRAFGALMLIFAFPNVLPAPPGLAAFLGLPLIYLSAQMMLGRMPWLPPFIDNRSLSRESFRTLIERANPILARVEKLLAERLGMLTSAPAERLLGGLCLALSLVLVLPVPLGNLMPALAICVIALGILERDGYWILAGMALSIAAFVWVGGLAYALVKSAIFVVMNAF